MSRNCHYTNTREARFIQVRCKTPAGSMSTNKLPFFINESTYKKCLREE